MALFPREKPELQASLEDLALTALESARRRNAEGDRSGFMELMAHITKTIVHPAEVLKDSAGSSSRPATTDHAVTSGCTEDELGEKRGRAHDVATHQLPTLLSKERLPADKSERLQVLRRLREMHSSAVDSPMMQCGFSDVGDAPGPARLTQSAEHGNGVPQEDEVDKAVAATGARMAAASAEEEDGAGTSPTRDGSADAAAQEHAENHAAGLLLSSSHDEANQPLPPAAAAARRAKSDLALLASLDMSGGKLGALLHR
uniref:Uncharacterized protein n=1 Tax=Rhizochromulina marina TaxID=1034831 RepID=A0A7S2S682_9STRA